MRKKITIICIIIVSLILLPIVCSASETYKISYDFGVANIRFETIKNSNPESFSSGDEITLNDPECPGFEFRGWYLEPDYKTELSVIDTSKSEDITLYAKWYEMTYSINYVLETPGIALESNDITNTNSFSRLSGEKTYLETPVCNTDIYSFEGWYSDKNYTQKIDFIDAYTCNDVTLYAHWVYTSFSVHYDLGDVKHSVFTTDNPNPEKYEFDTELILLDPITNDPSFTFDGWYVDEFFTQKITSIDAGTKGNIILYAKWNPVFYKINYVLDDNSGIDPAKIYNNNPDVISSAVTMTLSNPISENKSFAFDGWYTSSDYSESSKITAIPTDFKEDITLYAKWKTAVYNIIYDYGIVNTIYRPINNNNPETYKYADGTTLEDIEADGFIFNGWCTDKELKNKVTSIPSDSYGDITLFADFTEKTYSVTYILDCKEVTASQVVNKNATVRTTTQQITLNNPESINIEYEFDGWYLDSKYNQEIKYIKSYTTGNITLYAKWVKIIVYLPCWGDVTLSEQLSAADARMILRYSAGLETSFTEMQKKLSDINNDGTTNASDARLALRLTADLEDEYKIKKQYSLPDIIVEDGEIVFK